MLEAPKPVPAHAEVKRALESLLTRAGGAFVAHVQNDGSPGDPDEPPSAGWDLILPMTSTELVVRKNDPDASRMQFGASLESKREDIVVVAGMESNYCISATSRGALRRGLEVVLASGAHVTYDKVESAVAMANRVEEEPSRKGVKVVPTSKATFG